MTAGLTIFVSNQLEILSDRLVETISKPLDRPMQPEVVLIQSRGMERWISFKIAGQTGICANFRFPFPNAFLKNLFQKLFPELPADSPFDPDTLTFRVMKRLPALLSKPAFEGLRNYLEEDRRQLKLFQLSEKIADLFDQYLVFRPDMIFRWEKRETSDDETEQWQADLWRVLSDGHRKEHRAWLQTELIRKINSRKIDLSLLPSRISVFGVSYLPPFYLQTLVSLSSVMAVNLFVLSPCREFWADIRSESEIHRSTRYLTNVSTDPADLHLEIGNRLLASLGAQGRDFLNFLSDVPGEWVELFETLSRESLLGNIQTDILELRDQDESFDTIHDKRAAGGDTPNLLAASSEEDMHQSIPDDESIQIHVCHSPMREIEVLHDRLLSMFDTDPTLTAGDIVVMAPDIEFYAPYIQAVFDTQADPAGQIPFNIADQTALEKTPLLNSFFALLDLKDSRISAGQITDLLEAPGICSKLEFSDDELVQAVSWIRDLNIRWGIDAGSRKQLDLPAWPENTWKAGIDRLLLGLAMPPRNDKLYRGMLPYDIRDGEDSRVLGRLLGFLKLVFRYTAQLADTHTLAGWQKLLMKLLEDFIEPDHHTERELQVIREIIDRMRQQQELAEFVDRVDLELVRSYIKRRLQQRYFGSGFLSGGVTFCALLPMRSIPFKIVCMIGMNSDSFPRNTYAPDFDLIQRHPRPGDRQRRNDDKYLFLEALLSARKTLYISYIGQNQVDNSSMPPSVLVSDLIDIITYNYGVAAESIIIRHPLQAFSRKYFDADHKRLFSYSAENFKAAIQTPANSATDRFFDRPLAQADESYRNLALDQLCNFFTNPSQYLLNNRLGLYLRESQPVIPDTENFSLDGLDRFAVQRDQLSMSAKSVPYETQLAVQRAGGRIPVGSAGKLGFSELFDTGSKISILQRQLTSGRQPQVLEINLILGSFRISGSIADVYPVGIVMVHPGKMRSRHILAAWIKHVAYCAVLNTRKDPVSRVLFTDTVLQFDEVDNPDRILDKLLSIYWEGLHRPLNFFPDAALAFARQMISAAKPEKQALQKARRKWMGGEYSRGESMDVYYNQCFDKTDPLDDRFKQLALEIYAPLLEHMVVDG